MSYPVLTRSERIADGLVHLLGIGMAVTGTVLLFVFAGGRMDGPMTAATIIYATALLLMLVSSLAYHSAAYTWARPYLRRLDHAAIYIKIAGTFTPLAVLVDSAFSYMILGAVWGIALLGAGGKLFSGRGKMPTGWAPYVALGWVGALLFIPLWSLVPAASLILILAGGLTYTVGVVFYRWDDLRYCNAIWHSFVVAASCCFFLAITIASARAGMGY